MTLAEFREEPWKKSHDAYDKSFFNLRPAPEYASSEVLVSSLYRRSGYQGYAEGAVPRAGKEFDKARRPKEAEGPAHVSEDLWSTVLHGVMESPKLPNQSSRRFLQLSPVVPETALYSGSARSSGKSWNPGQLIERMILLGAASDEDAKALWSELHASLSVTDKDDIWARWLQEEFKWRSTVEQEWSPTSLSLEGGLPTANKAGLDYPARQFVRDLRAIIAAKDGMTRRQWISLLEAVLRLGSVTHVLWLCNVSDQLWRLARHVLEHGAVPASEEVSNHLFKITGPFATYGKPLIPNIRSHASRYLSARLGLNFLLWKLESDGLETKSLASLDDVTSLLKMISEHKHRLSGSIEEITDLKEQHTRALACKKGIGSNIVEFGRHVLGQRQAALEVLRGYDQGYFLRKGGQHQSAPWTVSLGPVAVLALVHCCLNEVEGPRSVQRLSDHLMRYGVSIHHNEVATSDLGHKLRMLGLVLDSPDAESGMLLMPPFDLDGARQ